MPSFLRLTWDHLWLLGALILVGVTIALAPTPPADFWWHLKAGQIIAEQGIPHTNLFAWTLPPDQPYVYGEWLAEWLTYRLYQLGGLAAPVLARNLLGLAAFGLVGLAARLRSGSWRLAALAIMIAGAMAINNLSARPQNWSWPPFALFALLLSTYAAGRLRPTALLALPIIMVLWVNLHGAFLLGLVLLACVLVGETLRQLLNRPGALGWRKVAWLAGAAVLTLCAALLNPLGSGIFHYVAGVLTDPSSRAFVQEWQPPPLRSYGGACFFITLGLLLSAWLVSKRRPTLTDALCAGAFSWVALGSQRYVMWAGMLLAPLLAQCLAGITLPSRQPDHGTGAARGRRSERRSAARKRSGHLPASVVAAPPATNIRSQPGVATIRVLLALGLLIVLVAVQPPFSLRLPIPGRTPTDYADVPGAPRLFERDTPVAAVEYLRSHPSEGRLFNELGYGSYVIWALGPSIPVFIDTRIELFPPALWHEYLAISNGRTLNELLIGKYDIERVLLSYQSQPRLATALAADSAHWRVEYRDATSAIYRRVR
jgi:hypothetical protein